ncbi:MAG: calcium-binding protein [Elainellaceae cyanobacterium]
MVLLSTAAGDGSVSVEVDAYGSFGSAVGGGVSDALYDPIGDGDAAGTTFESGVAIEINNAGSRTFLTIGSIGSSGSLEDPGFTSSDDDEAASVFSFSDLEFQLDQTTTDLLDEGTRTGSLLTQTYLITNPTSETISFELFRYIDGDLLFDGSISDGGGLIDNGDQEILFETDADDNPSTSTTFLGITAEGGDVSGPGRFELDSFSGLLDRIIDGVDLDDVITGDGADADSFVDSGGAFDVTLAFRNGFELAPGETVTYTTTTIFGTGAPEEVTLPSDDDDDKILIAGTAQSDNLAGSSAAEDFRGLAGDDNITGSGGNDCIFGGLGEDRIAGGADNDVVFGNGGDDRLSGNNGDDRLIGGFGDDLVFGGGGDDFISGGVGNDRIVGGAGDDEILGNRGRDRIIGGSGDDQITGGFGNDRITGGSGSDTFIYRGVRDVLDTITDFEVGSDLIDVSSLLQRAGLATDASALGDSIRLSGSESRTVVLFDRDGLDGGRDPLRLVALANVSVSDVGAESFIFG